MKRFTIKLEKTPSTSMNRWAPDPHRRGKVIPSKKTYTRKGQPRVGPSDILGV